ncbi:protein DinB [Xylanibacillus composti]|uniref:Protein DinB n=1 Tax=Xylanibacillus composti TaxID=1572762 RepID=A0A8J4M348_9BACL|nr:DinB family protein [Xylanibacillus composti]GIQ69607.1 protein DinB [Xylanibacillus composti]
MSKLMVRMYEHVYWANAKLLELLQGLQPVPARSLQLFAHVVAAEQIWLARLNREDTSRMEIWPRFDLSACEERVAANRLGYTEYLGSLDENDLFRLISYSNSTGKQFETSIGDILTHVSLHGSYHRGQIAASLAHAGLPVVNTDFIQFVRQTAAEDKYEK